MDKQQGTIQIYAKEFQSAKVRDNLNAEIIAIWEVVKKIEYKSKSTFVLVSECRLAVDLLLCPNMHRLDEREVWIENINVIRVGWSKDGRSEEICMADAMIWKGRWSEDA